ncbi:hypothetical protein BJ508DRAFT_374816 [Ascobolus immersus RN42]|uniref:Uncharacterized protein n=1 Tax=Ascobolus immersus RN42 TaxID=1160509 RepID=A0A3N4IDP7_ASCIM|nr:hypothetical protein BJ508DRAFT_374816 [Ascobolus immersus RN42]
MLPSRTPSSFASTKHTAEPKKRKKETKIESSSSPSPPPKKSRTKKRKTSKPEEGPEEIPFEFFAIDANARSWDEEKVVSVKVFGKEANFFQFKRLAIMTLDLSTTGHDGTDPSQFDVWALRKQDQKASSLPSLKLVPGRTTLGSEHPQYLSTIRTAKVTACLSRKCVYIFRKKLGPNSNELWSLLENRGLDTTIKLSNLHYIAPHMDHDDKRRKTMFNNPLSANDGPLFLPNHLTYQEPDGLMPFLQANKKHFILSGEDGEKHGNLVFETVSLWGSGRSTSLEKFRNNCIRAASNKKERDKVKDANIFQIDLTGDRTSQYNSLDLDQPEYSKDLEHDYTTDPERLLVGRMLHQLAPQMSLNEVINLLDKTACETNYAPTVEDVLDAARNSPDQITFLNIDGLERLQMTHPSTDDSHGDMLLNTLKLLDRLASSPTANVVVHVTAIRLEAFGNIFGTPEHPEGTYPGEFTSKFARVPTLGALNYVNMKTRVRMPDGTTELRPTFDMENPAVKIFLEDSEGVPRHVQDVLDRLTLFCKRQYPLQVDFQQHSMDAVTEQLVEQLWGRYENLLTRLKPTMSFLRGVTLVSILQHIMGRKAIDLRKQLVLPIYNRMSESEENKYGLARAPGLSLAALAESGLFYFVPSRLQKGKHFINVSIFTTIQLLRLGRRDHEECDLGTFLNYVEAIKYDDILSWRTRKVTVTKLPRFDTFEMFDMTFVELRSRLERNNCLVSLSAINQAVIFGTGTNLDEKFFNFHIKEVRKCSSRCATKISESNKGRGYDPKIAWVNAAGAPAGDGFITIWKDSKGKARFNIIFQDKMLLQSTDFTREDFNAESLRRILYPRDKDIPIIALGMSSMGRTHIGTWENIPFLEVTTLLNDAE